MPGTLGTLATPVRCTAFLFLRVSLDHRPCLVKLILRELILPHVSLRLAAAPVADDEEDDEAHLADAQHLGVGLALDPVAPEPLAVDAILVNPLGRGPGTLDLDHRAV